MIQKYKSVKLYELQAKHFRFIVIANYLVYNFCCLFKRNLLIIKLKKFSAIINIQNSHQSYLFHFKKQLVCFEMHMTFRFFNENVQQNSVKDSQFLYLFKAQYLKCRKHTNNFLHKIIHRNIMNGNKIILLLIMPKHNKNQLAEHL